MIHYCKLQIEADEYQWYYSVDALQSVLYQKFLHKKLNKVYVCLYGYLDSPRNNPSCIDLSYMGGCTILQFENECIQLEFASEGMLRCRFFPAWQMKCKTYFEYHHPDDMRADFDDSPYYYDASLHFSLPFENQSVSKVITKGTDSWPFPQQQFDENIAEIYAEKGKLPSSFSFELENGNILSVVGDTIEYYFLELYKKE